MKRVQRYYRKEYHNFHIEHLKSSLFLLHLTDGHTDNIDYIVDMVYVLSRHNWDLLSNFGFLFLQW